MPSGYRQCTGASSADLYQRALRAKQERGIALGRDEPFTRKFWSFLLEILVEAILLLGL